MPTKPKPKKATTASKRGKQHSIHSESLLNLSKKLREEDDCVYLTAVRLADLFEKEAKRVRLIVR